MDVLAEGLLGSEKAGGDSPCPLRPREMMAKTN